MPLSRLGLLSWLWYHYLTGHFQVWGEGFASSYIHSNDWHWVHSFYMYKRVCIDYFFVFSELNLSVIKPYANFLKISGINNVFCEFILSSSPVHAPRYMYIHREACKLPREVLVMCMSLVCFVFFFPLVNGTTGESLNLTTEERKLLAEEWIKQAKGK